MIDMRARPDSALSLAVVLAMAACAAPPSAPTDAARGGPATTVARGETTAPATLDPAGAGGMATAEPALARPQTVRGGLVGATSDAGIYIAQERGHFAQEGLEIELSQFVSGEQM